MREIEFYKSSNGRSPVEEFLDSLTDKHAQKVAWVLRLIERFDLVPQQYFKKLVGTDYIWEIRIKIGKTNYRLLGFIHDDKMVILTNAFSKKQQKTPQNEIDLALQRRKEYLERRK